MRTLALLMLLLPLPLFAAVPAGFPSEGVWLSKTAPVAGDSVTLYTVVYNSTDTAIAGSVVFLIDNASIATKSFSAPAGTTQIVSVPWSATQGAHQLSARIEGVSSLELSKLASGTTTISVAAPPPPPEAVTATIAAADAASALVASTTPIVQSVASTTATVAEDFRMQTLSALTALASSTAPKGEVLGASDEAVSEESAEPSSPGLMSYVGGAWQWLLALLIAIASSPWWFYLTLAVVAFLIISFLRAALRERRDR